MLFRTLEIRGTAKRPYPSRGEPQQLRHRRKRAARLCTRPGRRAERIGVVARRGDSSHLKTPVLAFPTSRRAPSAHQCTHCGAHMPARALQTPGRCTRYDGSTLCYFLAQVRPVCGSVEAVARAGARLTLRGIVGAATRVANGPAASWSPTAGDTPPSSSLPTRLKRWWRPRGPCWSCSNIKLARNLVSFSCGFGVVNLSQLYQPQHPLCACRTHQALQPAH